MLVFNKILTVLNYVENNNHARMCRNASAGCIVRKNGMGAEKGQKKGQGSGAARGVRLGRKRETGQIGPRGENISIADTAKVI